MDLVGGHRRPIRIARGALGHPGVVGPRVGRGIPHARRGLRPDLHGEGERIGLEAQRAVAAEDLELVELARADAGARRAPTRRRRPSSASACRRPSQRSKSPTIRTLRAFGAQTAKLTPSTPWCVRGCAPSTSYSRSCVPSPMRCRSTSPSVGPNRYGSSQLPRVAVGEGEAHAVRELAGSQVGDEAGPHAVADRLHRRAAAVRRDERRPRSHRGGRRGRRCRPRRGWAPRMECGSWCSPRARRASSSAPVPRAWRSSSG